MAAANIPLDLSKLKVKELNDFIKKNKIRLVSGLTKQDKIFFIEQTIQRRQERRLNKIKIDISKLRETLVGRRAKEHPELIGYFKNLLDYYRVDIDLSGGFKSGFGGMVSGPFIPSDNGFYNPDFDEVMLELGLFEDIKGAVPSLVMMEDDQNKKMADIVEQKKIQRANKIPKFDLNKPLLRNTTLNKKITKVYTYGDIYELLKPVGPFKDVYSRWEAIHDKQTFVNMMFQILAERSSSIVKARDIIQYFNPTDIRYFLMDILSKSNNQHLRNAKYMIASLEKTASDLYAIGRHTTIKNKGSGQIMDPEHLDRPLVWDQFLGLVFAFIKLLPPPIQLAWAESYLTAFIEGYDLKVCAFPEAVIVFGRSHILGQQAYPSCILGMFYHTLISLYQVLFESNDEVRMRQKEAEEKDPEQKTETVPIGYRRAILTDLLQRFHAENPDDLKEDEVDAMKHLFEAYAKSFPALNDGYDWDELIAEVGSAIEYFGLKRRNKRSTIKKNSKRGCKRKGSKRGCKRRGSKHR